MTKTFSCNKLFRWLVILSFLQAFTTPAWPTSAAQAALNSLPPLRQELWVPDGAVFDAMISGNTLYIGGNFTRLGPPTGGWVGLQADTGNRRAELPRVAGSVDEIISDQSGGWYLGGDFYAVDGYRAAIWLMSWEMPKTSCATKTTFYLAVIKYFLIGLLP